MNKILNIGERIWFLWCLTVIFLLIEFIVIASFILTLGSKHGRKTFDYYISNMEVKEWE